MISVVGVVLAACLAGPLAQPETKDESVGKILRGLVAPEEPKKQGHAARVKSVVAKAEWRKDVLGQWKESKNVAATVIIEGEDTYVAGVSTTLTEVLDEDGNNLLLELVPAKAWQSERQTLEQAFWLQLRSKPKGRPPLEAKGVVTKLPSKYQRVAGEVACMVGTLVKKDVEPTEMEEPVEIVPGVTFQWSKVPGDAKAKDGVFSYEVRVQREKGEKAGREPVFAGILLEDDEGRVVMQWQNQQRVDTVKEYLYVGRAFQLPKSSRERVKDWNVCVFNDLRLERFEFEARDLKVAPPRGGDGKPIIEDDATGK